MSHFFFRAVAVAMLSALALTVPAQAQTVSYSNVVDSTSPVFNTFRFLSLNDGGVVAFSATRDAGGVGVYSIRNGVTTPHLETGAQYSFIDYVSMNNTGTVAITASRTSDLVGGLYTSNGSGLTTIATGDDPRYQSFGNFRINNSGAIAFNATRPSGYSVIEKYANGSINTVAETAGFPGPFSSLGGIPDMNNLGTVAFQGTIYSGADGIQGLYTSTGGTQNLLVSQSNTSFTLFTNIALSDNGTLAFRAFGTGGVQGLYTTTGSGVTTLADSTSPVYSAFSGLATNASGGIAFDAELDAGGTAIFASLPGGSGPFRIVGTGDSLFGSTVTEVGIGRESLNNSDQLLFSYQLADGRRGAGIANIGATVVPESNTALLMGAILPLIGGIAVARRRRN